jgi:UDP-N-acetylmuramoylalanine--D-glutamate ligase
MRDHVCVLDACFDGKTIGVWGVGVGGRALVDFLAQRSHKYVVFDERAQLDVPEHCVVHTLDQFFALSDIVIPSAGIDTSVVGEYAHKCVAELDFFYAHVHKPIVAITGTLGKTTVTTMVARALEYAGYRVLVGGNIGVGLCSLIDQQDACDFIVLEVSSFQLELCARFAPHVALWTNFYPNHLDRHKTVAAYFNAKCAIVRNQKKDDYALIPRSLVGDIAPYCRGKVCEIASCISDIACVHNHAVVYEQSGMIDGVEENWCSVAAVLQVLGVDSMALRGSQGCVLEHRMEKVRVVNDITFINDSKATVSQATLSAVTRLSGMPVVLLLGGLSKGVSREGLFSALSGKVESVVCFGAESDELMMLAQRYEIACEKAATFVDAVNMGYVRGRPGGCVLLSPGGSSFDMFADYQERGRVFKACVNQL